MTVEKKAFLCFFLQDAEGTYQLPEYANAEKKNGADYNH